MGRNEGACGGAQRRVGMQDAPSECLRVALPTSPRAADSPPDTSVQCGAEPWGGVWCSGSVLRRFLRSVPAGCCGIGCVRRGAGSAARSGCIAHEALGRNRHTSLWYIC